MSYEHNKTWRILNPQARQAQTKRYYDASVPGAFRSKSNWTDDEDSAVLDQAVTDNVLAARIGRTIRSIQNRRYRLKEDERANRFVIDDA